MKLFCFDLNQDKNRPGRKLYKKTTGVGDLPGAGDFAEWADWKRGQSKELSAWMKKDRGTRAAFDSLRTTTKTKKSLGKVPHPVTPRAKEKLKIRTQKEIFGSKECQEWYIRNVKEALEKLKGDRLHAFIKAHQKYGKGNYIQWNSEFADLLGLNVPAKYRGGSAHMMHRRITAATQHVLVDYYNNDVFQLTKEKVNKWIKIDGMTGPYTSSVLGDYWNSVHGPTSTKPHLGRSGLGWGYPEGGTGRKTYAAAMAWLIAQLAESTRDKVETPEDVPPAKQLKRRVEKRRKTIEKYRDLDKDKGEKVKLKDLYIRHHELKKDHPNLLSALAEVYRENPRTPKQSKKLFRAMYLLALKGGAEIDQMKVKKGDIIIVADGFLTVRRSNTTNRHRIPMKEPKHT